MVWSGEIGDMPLGVWEFDLDSMFRLPSDMLLSETF